MIPSQVALSLRPGQGIGMRQGGDQPSARPDMMAGRCQPAGIVRASQSCLVRTGLLGQDDCRADGVLRAARVVQLGPDTWPV